MPIQQLTDEQIRTWTREEKDRWWLANIFRGDMPQLTLRAAITGFLLGGILSATNLYIGAKTGWTLGVGLTSVILAFACFKALASLGAARDFTILENNAMQSIATSAGYMTGPLISGLAAYMMVTNKVMPWHQMLWFNVVLSVLGVLVAFPMKRRFINDEQAPFPEGRACGVLLDTLYTSEPATGVFKAKVLVGAGLIAAFIKFLGGESYQQLLQARLLGLKTVYWLSENLDHAYYQLVDAGKVGMVRLWGAHGVDPRQVGLSPTLDLAMFGAGGLTGFRACANMCVGMLLCWGILVPWRIMAGELTDKSGNFMNAAGKMVNAAGELVMKADASGQMVEVAANYTQRDLLAKWALWPGIGLIVCASMVSFFAKPKVIISAFTGFFNRGKAKGQDVLGHIELPLWVSFIGIPVVGAVGVWMAHDWFGVKWEFGALSIPLIIVLTLIAANATALTSITPTGSMSKITQLTFGGLDRAEALKTGAAPNAGVNLMTACMTTEVASNASNLLMDIKPGYMLGAKPRQQVVGHMIGIFAGALASTPLFYVLFLSDAARKDLPVIERLPSKDFSFTAALQWKGISDLITGGNMSALASSAQTAMILGAIVGVVFEIVRIVTRNKSVFSPLAFGLGFVLPPDSVMAMFGGAVFFSIMHRIYGKRHGTFGHHLWVGTHEPICAGLIAGAALTGIGNILVKAFLL